MRKLRTDNFNNAFSFLILLFLSTTRIFALNSTEKREANGKNGFVREILGIESTISAEGGEARVGAVRAKEEERRERMGN